MSPGVSCVFDLARDLAREAGKRRRTPYLDERRSGHLHLVHEQVVPPPRRPPFFRPRWSPSPPISRIVDQFEAQDRRRQEDGEEDDGELEEPQAGRDGFDEVLADQVPHVPDKDESPRRRVAIVRVVVRIRRDQELVRIRFLDIVEDALQRMFACDAAVAAAAALRRRVARIGGIAGIRRVEPQG